MKKIFITALLFSLVGWAATLQADDQATYTITGTKDKRLDAWYSATYVSQNLEDEACSHYARHKGFRRPKIASRGIGIEDVNYTIKLPITLAEDENNCNYRFSGLMLIMRRMNDEKLSSIHYILSDQKEVRPVYWKTERGESYDPHPDTPPSLVTDKKYFRIAKETAFLCKTYWYEYRQGSDFHCTMQIGDGLNDNKFIPSRKFKSFVNQVTHPKFGVDEIKDETMKIDILVDEKNCKTVKNRKVVPDHFREVGTWQKFKNLF